MPKFLKWIMSGKTPDAPNRQFNLSLLALSVINFVPHLEEHMLITVLVAGLCLSWRFLYEMQITKLPNFAIKFVLIATTWVLVWKIHKSLTGVEPATALLVAAIALKLIDSVSYRDAMVLLFLNFLLLMARFLVSQTMAMTIFGFINVVVVTALLMQLHQGKDLNFNLKSLLKTGLRITAQTAPLLVLLFFVFPRFSTGFFSLSSKNVGQTGFSPQLEPGEIAQLVQSDKVAFRVKFASGKAPHPRLRYWKGVQLDWNNGMRWRKSFVHNYPKNNFTPKINENSKQTITLEPGFGKYLFVLDNPQWVSFNDRTRDKSTFATSDHTFFIKNDNLQHKLYQAYSRPPEVEEINRESLRKYTQTNNESDSRVAELVAKIKGEVLDGAQIADKLLKYFSKGFTYTLKPGAMESTKIAEFIFEKKEGFCEHYAASFASLMRLAGVPARIALGFQGGTANDLDDYYIIKSKDAHAWVEIYSMAQKKWLRYDPTEVVANLRLEVGGDIYHSFDEETLRAGMSQDELMNLYNSSWYNRTVGKALLSWDMVSARWNNFLLNYDSVGQRSYFKDFGFKSLTSKSFALLSSVIVLLFLLWLRWQKVRNSPKISKHKKLYHELVVWLEAQGLAKVRSEGPKDFLMRGEAFYNQQNDELKKFKEIFLQVQYGDNLASRKNIDRLKICLIKIKKFPRTDKAG